jgi:hypothetical protein
MHVLRDRDRRFKAHGGAGCVVASGSRSGRRSRPRGAGRGRAWGRPPLLPQLSGAYISRRPRGAGGRRRAAAGPGHISTMGGSSRNVQNSISSGLQPMYPHLCESNDRRTIDDQMSQDKVGRFTRLATLHNSAMLAPSHPDTNARCSRRDDDRPRATAPPR